MSITAAAFAPERDTGGIGATVVTQARGRRDRTLAADAAVFRPIEILTSAFRMEKTSMGRHAFVACRTPLGESCGTMHFTEPRPGAYDCACGSALRSGEVGSLHPMSTSGLQRSFILSVSCFSTARPDRDSRLGWPASSTAAARPGVPGPPTNIGIGPGLQRTGSNRLLRSRSACSTRVAGRRKPSILQPGFASPGSADRATICRCARFGRIYVCARGNARGHRRPACSASI